ncbi:MAG: 4Fe-4S binding protein [Anaerovoracaceae bacterium]
MAKGKLKFEIDKCKGCEICVSVCPKKILEIDKTKTNKKDYRPVTCINEDECIGCGNCAVMCPDGVISVYKED